MKLNKKVIIFLPIIIAVVVFLSLYYYFNRQDQNSLTVSDKKWIESNISTIFDLELISNYLSDVDKKNLKQLNISE